MDPLFFLELAIVGVIIVIQLRVFSKNRSAIYSLSDVYPEPTSLQVEKEQQDAEEDENFFTLTPETELIQNNEQYHSIFQEILYTTNAYLSKNQGAADFETISEIAERRIESLEDSIESNIALPLYIGLLCTFLGVIIGLVKIAIVGVSDAAIQSFIGGVLIGMLGSAAGLSLTVRSNYLFREGRKVRDRKQYDYFTFIRTYILPAKKKQLQEPISTLRDNLAAFIEGFVQNQQYMNDSLQESLRLFRELKDVFKQIRSIEHGLESVGNSLRENDHLIDKQVAFIESYASRTEQISQQMGSKVSEIDRRLESTIQENLQVLDSSTKAAYVKMDQYLATLDNTDTAAFSQALQQDLHNLRGNIDQIQHRSLEIQSKLLSTLQHKEQEDTEVRAQLLAIHDKLDAQAASGFMDSFEFKLFVYTGSAAFILSIVGGAMYVLNTVFA